MKDFAQLDILRKITDEQDDLTLKFYLSLAKDIILDNIVADDWEVVNGDAITGLDITTFTFGEAISRMKRGQKVARKGWNGKKQYIELASNISYVNPNGDIINCEHDAIGNKAIAFVGTSGVQMGWLASQADMLAEDWHVVE